VVDICIGVSSSLIAAGGNCRGLHPDAPVAVLLCEGRRHSREKEEDPGPDAYLAFTREEPDDLSDPNQGGESLPPAKKARGDPSVKPASRLRSHNRCT